MSTQPSQRAPEDPRIGQFERERAEAVELAHRAMHSSYIGAPPPGLRGDADRMVAALLKAGWTPPGERTAEYAQVDGKEYRRRVVIVEDWAEVRRCAALTVTPRGET